MKTWAVKWILASGLWLALLSLPARAGTLVVNSTSDHAVGPCDAADCTLREAITAAQTNDTITFAANVTGTITLTGGQIVINKNLTITGPGARVLEVSGNNASRIFSISGGASLSISGLDLINGVVANVVHAQGGAIYVIGSLFLNACSFSSNAANGIDFNGGTFVSPGSGEGGAIYVNDFATLVARNCTFAFNSAQGTSVSGGAIWNAGRTVLVNSTVSNNVLKPNSDLVGASYESATGGGIFQKRGTVTIVNSTIYGNNYFAIHGTTVGVGGGVAKNDGTATLQNTIVAGNTAASNTSHNVYGSFTSRGFNLLQDTQGSSGWIATDKTSATAGELKFTGLVDNGGPANTHAPLAGCVAIDMGEDSLAMDPGANLVPGDGDDSPLTTDQRGYARVVGSRVDVGAVEFEPAQIAPSFVVTTTDHHDDGLCGVADCSLWEAINASNANTANNSVITFAPTAYGTITNTTLAGGFGITRPVRISGPGADLVAVSGAGVNRLFNITSAGVIALSNVTIRDARSTSGDGGALRYNGSGTLAIDACRFTNNTTAENWSGGAIWTVGRLTITNSDFGGNKGGGGGAVYPRFGSVVTVSACSFHENEAINTAGGGLGGAMLLWDGPNVTISNSTFINNKATKSGGAIHVLANSTLNITNSVFSGNSVSAAGSGGALLNSGNMQLTGVTLNVNNADSGYGGGIHSSGTCTLTNVTLSGNTANGNSASPGYGGAIYNVGTATLTNVTLSGNSGFNVGGISRAGGSITLKNTAIARGASGENCGGFTGGTSNLSDDGTCGFSTGTENRDGINLLLGPLANNGGPTQTHLPSINPKSPLIDSGTDGGAPPTDQRGMSRPQGSGFDVGAVEVAPSDNPAIPGRLGNISTRLRVETGDNVLIGGFIVTGTQPKKVIVRGIGTSVPFFDKLENPTLELHGPAGLIESNDNWVDSPNRQAISDSTIPPSSDLESAIVATLPANGTGYTAILRGVNEGTGIGLVEIYDLDGSANSKLANISTRGLVRTADNVLIAGTIVLGEAQQKVIIRAIGPSLGIVGNLDDPSLQLLDANGTQLAFNDNWRSDQEAEIIATTIPPPSEFESAIVAALPANGASYTAIVRGVGNTTGIAVVEVYALP